MFASFRDKINVVMANMEDVKEISKFKAHGKDIVDGLLNTLSEKIDMTLLNDFRSDYVLKGNFDSKNNVFDVK